MKLLGNKKIVTTLLFRGSEHGWMLKDFHSRCDNKSPTITLFKIKDGDCIGGFSTLQYKSVDEDGKFYVDSDSFLFNLSSSSQFTNSGNGGIFCGTHVGLAFSNEQTLELCARFEPFNDDNACASCAYQSGYCIGLEYGKNMLTNKEDGDFTISELEVWEVVNAKDIKVYKGGYCSNQ